MTRSTRTSTVADAAAGGDLPGYPLADAEPVQIGTASCDCPVFFRLGCQHREGCGNAGTAPAGVPAPRSREASYVLADELHFSRVLRRGALLMFPGELGNALSFGLTEATFGEGESTEELRTALKTFGEWLVRVAETAH